MATIQVPLCDTSNISLLQRNQIECKVSRNFILVSNENFVPRCQESLQGTLWCANSLTRLVRSYQGGLRAFRASTDPRYPKNQLHHHISRQESGSSRGVPDPSASLDAIHPADRSSPHVSGSKDLNLLLPQV